MAAADEPVIGQQLDALMARRDGLRERRDGLILARRAEEAEVAAYTVVMRAVADARRCRDTATSTRMSRHRTALEQVMVDVEAVELTIACIWRRVVNLELPDDHPDHRRARRATERGLGALQRLSDDLRCAMHIEEVTDGPG